MKLLGTFTIKGKTFTEKDSTGLVTREQLGISDNFYGGSIKEFYKTRYGIYMCLLGKKRQIVNLGYFKDKLTKEGIELLGLLKGIDELSGPIMKETKNQQNEDIDRNTLIAQARSLGLKGVLENMKTETLIKKISSVK